MSGLLTYRVLIKSGGYVATGFTHSGVIQNQFVHEAA